MFGLTKREQRWKAEQQAAEVLAGLAAVAIRVATDARVAEAQVDAAELERLRAARDDFHQAYRQKCDVETKAQAVEIEQLRALLVRYRDDVPLGHQPHMIAHLVDEALGRAQRKVNGRPALKRAKRGMPQAVPSNDCYAALLREARR